jgi:hypothetical protein
MDIGPKRRDHTAVRIRTREVSLCWDLFCDRVDPPGEFLAGQTVVREVQYGDVRIRRLVEKVRVVREEYVVVGLGVFEDPGVVGPLPGSSSA